MPNEPGGRGGASYRAVNAQLRAVAIFVLLTPGLGSCAPPPMPTAAPSPVPTATPSPVPTGTPAVTARPFAVLCEPDLGTVAPALAGDPCPGAIAAVELAVAKVGHPIDRVVIEPGPFFCDVIWPNASAPPMCYGPLVVSGQFRHAWVSFDGSEEVAAVMLGRDLPPDLNAPAAVPLPWSATLVRVEVPPAGWVMP
jgi:hypothetical protein